MAKPATPTTPDASTLDIEYVGPDGHTSPVFGLLVVGQRYQADAAFAEYLCDTHPDYWKRPDA